MNSATKNIVRAGTLENGNAYTIVGRAHNGTAAEMSDGIVKVGQDVAMVLPRFNVVGVFDGAGGATDIGSPEKAALTAAYAVERYFTDGGNDLTNAMEFARNAVKADQAAGLCVAALARFCHETVHTVNAGDTEIICYDTTHGKLDVVATQQSEHGQPTNYLGRRAARLALPVADAATSYQQPHRSGKEVYVLSDGAFGNWQLSNSLEDYHFKAAHDDYQLLREARAYDSHFEQNIRALLAGDAGARLAGKQIGEMGHTYSPELDDPALFSASSFDWDIWQAIVQPYIATLGVPRSATGGHEIGESLLERPISWKFEKSPNDDATLVIVEPVAHSGQTS
ncbi:MAG: hypothetical protein JWM07_405 [Candidatus Saccharibacteria bacterium]|nr:hypothetical protein [Candidatus Saccharibacteria bacterium]